MSGLKVVPAAVELHDVQPGVSQVVTVTIQNTSQRVKTVRVRPPKSKYFSINGFQQSQKLSPGLEVTFEVHFLGEALTGSEPRELLADKLVIQTDSGEHELPLKVITARPDVHIEGDLMFGLVPVDSRASKTFRLVNHGAALADFKLDWDKSSGLTLVPASGKLPAAGAGETNSLDVTASLLVQDAGSLSGDVTVLVAGQGGGPEGRKLTYTATAVKQGFELLDANNARVTELDFGCLFFGAGTSKTVTIFNNGPVAAKYLLSYGSSAEMKSRADDDGAARATDDSDDAYADIISATHQRLRAKATNDNPFTITPLGATIPPYGKVNVQISFKPQGVPESKGFQAKQAPSDSTLRIFDFMALVDFAGCPAAARLRLPLRGKGQAASVRATPQSLLFGEVGCYSWADQLVLLVNSSTTMPARWECPTSALPYFKAQPAAGMLAPGQDCQVVVRFMPHALGTHQGALPIHIMGEHSDTVVQRLAIQVCGSSQRMAEKGQLVGGPNKVAADFVKPPQFVSDEQVLRSTTKATKAGTPFWEQPDVEQAFLDIGPAGTRHALSKSDFLTMQQHKEKYIAAMRERRTEAKHKASAKRAANESDVNLGLDSHSGLVAPQPRLPSQPDPLWTTAALEAAQPKQQRTILPSELASIPRHKDRPVGEVEQHAVCRELSKEQINRLIVGPKVVDFGAVSVGSTAEQYLVLTNTLDQPIHVVLDLKAVPELKASRHTSQVVPAASRAKFPLTLVSSDIKSISEKVDYCINSAHCLSVGVVARVVPVTVELSSEEVQFEYSLDDWDTTLERILQVSNPHKFPVEFSLACTMPHAFSCSPTEGVIKPQSAMELNIRWSLPTELYAPPPPPPKKNGPGAMQRQTSTAGAKAKGAEELAVASPAQLPANGVQEAVLILTLLGGDHPRRIALQGQLPEVGLRLKDKSLDAGPVPLFTPQTITAQLCNTGTRAAAFKVLPNPKIQVSPDKLRVAPDEVVDLQVTFTLNQPGLLATNLEVQIQGGRLLKIPFKAEGVLPLVEVKQESFDFGPVYLGAFARLPFTITNTTPVPAKLMVDMLRIPDVQLTLAKDAWSTSEYEECPLQKIGASGEIIGRGSRNTSTSGDASRVSRRSSSISALGFTGCTGYKFTIAVNPSKSLDLQLVYKASAAGPQSWDLALTSLVGSGVAPIIRTVTAEGLKPRLIISKTSLDFGVQTVIRSNQIKPPYSQLLYLTNPEGEEPLPVRLGPLAGPDAGMFALDGEPGFTIQPGEMRQVEVHFTPRDGRCYEASLPLYLDGETSDPYLSIEVVAQGQHPRLTFDVRECILPPVPLGVRSQATFHVVNVNYDNLELRFRLPADESHLPLKLDFPEGNLIGMARERLPVVVSFEAVRPVSFTANIDFMDEDGKRYSIPVSAAADNCLLTHQPFMQANRGKLQLSAGDLQGPICLVTGEGAPAYELPHPSTALGATDPIHSIAHYLNAASGRGPYDRQLHAQLVGSRGKLLTELLELLSGKKLPGKVPKLSSNRKDAAEQLLGAYDAALTFLRAHGALLNAVKPEMLLDADDFDRIMATRQARAEEDIEAQEALARWADVQESWEVVSVQAWNAVLAQAFKVFVLGRVTLKALRTLPGMMGPPAPGAVPLPTLGTSPSVPPPGSAGSQGAALGSMYDGPSAPTSRAGTAGGAGAAMPAADPVLLQPPDSAILGSNLYSVAEGCLLAWASAHYAREFGARAARLTNFDEDFRDGAALFSVLAGYWPAYSYKKSALRLGPGLSPAECADNAELVVRLLADLGLPYELSAKDIYEPDAREMLVLLLYLFQTLPQLLPRTTIEFNGRLGETQVKELELSNPSRKAIAYTARLEGHPDFAVDASVVRIDAQGVAKLPCKCTPTTSLIQEARLVLMSKRDSGGAYAATLVFALRSAINTRAPLKRVRTEGPLYEMQQFEFTITNPFKTDGDFSISLLHEPAEPVARPAEPKTKGKKKAAGAAGNPAKEASPAAGGAPATSKLYPCAFGLDRMRIRLKANGSDKVRASFLPFFMGTHYCTVILKDKEQGEFVYELVGETLLPAPMMEFKGVVPLEGPHHTCDLCVPLVNPQLEAAKRTFLEKHPLAKDRSQAALLKLEPTKTLGDAALVYNLSQTNSLISCPSQLTLSASAVPPVPVQKGGPPPGKKDEATPPGIVRLALKPVGTGIYPTRLLLTSTAGVDTRVVDVELTAQTMQQQFDLIFECAARQTITQDIPLVNASDQYMVVVGSLSGGPGAKAFSAGKEVSVPPSSTSAYHLTFKPTATGDHNATLELSIPSTGERNTYRLIGKVSEPVAESHILLECQARVPVTRTIAVPNIVGGATEYQVLSSLDCVAGPASIRVAGSQATAYKLTAAPIRSGTFVGSLTFKTSEGQYVWFSVEVRAMEPPEVGHIDVTAQVHSVVSIQVSAVNPLPEPLALGVRYSHPDVLLGPTTVTLPPSSEGPTQLEFFYAPLVEGSQQGAITLVSQELGEFWYHLSMTAEPSAPIELPPLRAPLGGAAATQASIANPLPRPTTVHASISSDAACFSVVPAVLHLAPHAEAVVEVRYSPTHLGPAPDLATLTLSSPDIGTHTYSAQGVGEAPDVMPETTVHVRPGGFGRGVIVWHNPFPQEVMAYVALEGDATASDHITLAIRGNSSEPKATHKPPPAPGASAAGSSCSVARGGTLQIPVQCRAPLEPLTTAEVTLTVTTPADLRASGAGDSEPLPMTWRFPVVLVVDAAAADTPVTAGAGFSFSCKTHDCIEEALDVVLRGVGALPAEGEVCRHEVVVPPQYAAQLGPDVLAITPAAGGGNRLTSPDEPLKFVLRFSPRSVLTATVGLVVAKPSGGRWRFDVQLTATDPASSGVITLEAAMDTTSSVVVPLYSSTSEPQPFTAWLSTDTSLSFDLRPAKGMLPVKPSSPQQEEAATLQQRRRSSRTAALEPGTSQLTVTYTCRDFDKVIKGRLYVQTPDTQYSFELHGRMPTYVAPKPSDFASSVDNKLSPEVQRRLRAAANPQAHRPNYVMGNIRNTRPRGTWE